MTHYVQETDTEGTTFLYISASSRQPFLLCILFEVHPWLSYIKWLGFVHVWSIL